MGNNLTYRTHDPAVFAPKIEELVRKDVGSALRLDYRVHNLNVPKASLGAILGDGATLQGGGDLPLLARVDIRLPWHAPAFLMVWMRRYGVRAQVAGITFQFDLVRSVGGTAQLQLRPGTTPRFIGVGAADHLNRVAGLAERAAKLARRDALIDQMALRLEPVLQVSDDGQTPRLVFATLPRGTGFLGSSATTDAGEVIRLARDIEAALPV